MKRAPRTKKKKKRTLLRYLVLSLIDERGTSRAKREIKWNDDVGTLCARQIPFLSRVISFVNFFCRTFSVFSLGGFTLLFLHCKKEKRVTSECSL